MKKEITIEVDPEIGLYTITITRLFFDLLIEKHQSMFDEMSPHLNVRINEKEKKMKEFLEDLFDKLRDSTTIEENLANRITRYD